MSAQGTSRVGQIFLDNPRLFQRLSDYGIHIQAQDEFEGLPKETSLLRRLQAQTLPDAASPIGKVHPFSKIAVTFEPVMQFGFGDLEFL